MSIYNYIVKRILQGILIIFIVSFISFFLIRLSPVDPLAELKMNPSITRRTLEEEKIRLGLDKPILIQYFIWGKNFVRGNMGTTVSGEKVSVKIKERAFNTVLLSLSVIFWTWIIGIPLGVIAALNYRSTFDRILTVLSSVGMAIPSFFFAILLLIFAQKTGWFPIGGLTSPNFSNLDLWHKFFDVMHHLFLPTLVLTTISLAGLSRQMRSNLLDVLDSDYVKFAKAKGLPPSKVIVKHALRNAINPLVTLLGFECAALLSGAALTEYVFQYPGLGRLILEAVMKSDINLVMASLVIGSFMLILGNILADILLKLTDPRVRL